MFSLKRNPAAEMTVIPALGVTSVTAGGAGDATAANGISIDTLARARTEAVAFIVYAEATLASGKTLSAPIKVQSSADGSTWADVDPAYAKHSQKTLSLAATGKAAVAVDVPLEYCDRYVRVVVTPDMSATGTDTASLNAVAVMYLERQSVNAG